MNLKSSRSFFWLDFKYEENDLRRTPMSIRTDS